MEHVSSDFEGNCIEIALRKYQLVSPAAGHTYLEQVLEDASEKGQHLPLLEQYYARWSRFLDPAFIPPALPAEEDVEPLLAKSSFCAKEGDLSGTLGFGWDYLQHVPFGTLRFQNALASLIDYLLHQDAIEQALPLAELFLLHRRIRDVIPAVAGVDNSNEDPEDEQLPVKAALLASTEYPDPAWVEIAELVLGRYDQHSPLGEQVRHNLERLISRS